MHITLTNNIMTCPIYPVTTHYQYAVEKLKFHWFRQSYLDIIVVFLSRVSILTCDVDIANLSVCLSVPDVSVSDENGLTYRHSFFSPYDGPIILVLQASNIFTKFRRGHPCGGAKYRWGIKISWFSTNKSLYLANDTRYRHSYYRRRIENRT